MELPADFLSLGRGSVTWYDLSVKSSGIWLLFSDLDLASTGTSFEIIALEVIGSTFRVDTVRGEPRTLFTSVAVASPFWIDLHRRKV